MAFQLGKGAVVRYWLFAVPQCALDTRIYDKLFTFEYSRTIWQSVREKEMRKGNVEPTSEDQGAIQQPDVAEDPGFVFGIKKHTAWPIEEDIDSVIVFK
jgi:hypothetical protein